MLSSIKYERFLQVASKQKQTFIMWFDVQCGQESISEKHSFACSHGGGRTRFAEVRNKDRRAVAMGLTVSSRCISLSAVSYAAWINN